MEQKTTRVANVGELFAPITTGLDNATFDPCSVGNPNPPAPGSELFQRCVQTGMLGGQVGTVPDIISGQINVFNGTNPDNLPTPEEGRSTTIGLVWEPEGGFFDSLLPTTISLDYYDIEITDYIDEPTGQEALDICYVLADPACLAGVVRIGGAITQFRVLASLRSSRTFPTGKLRVSTFKSIPDLISAATAILACHGQRIST